MIINTNMASLNTIRQLGINQKATQNSLAKLSSGLRINTAADDAAGLAISEKMRGQISGLNTASSNAQTGINMVSTAEGALNETTSILQRMRELAVQAGSDTNTTTDRGAMQTEMNQLTSEVNRIGNTTQFNTQNLLKGGDGSAAVTKTGLASFPAAALLSGGSLDTKTQAQVVDTMATIGAATSGLSATFHIGGTDFTVNTDNTQNLASSTVSADGKTITLGTSDGATALASATTSSNAIAGLLTTALSNAGLSSQYTATGGATLTIKAVAGSAADGTAGNILATTGSTSIDATPGAVTQGTNVAGNQATAVDFADFSAVASAAAAAAYVGKGFTIDNKTVQFYDGAAGSYTGNGVGVDIHGAASGADIVSDIVSQAGTKFSDVTLSQGSTASKLTATAINRGTAGNNIAVTDGGVKKDFVATLQIGANTGQTMTVTINDMRSQALDISGTTASGTITAKNGVKATLTAVTAASDGTSSTNTEFTLDLSSAANATAAVSVIDDAINSVSSERSNLGAYQNRLEHTINNLGTSSQNITAAEASIRDVDMAAEMTNFQKNNILQQAAQAMLAQANQQPQGVLQLLR